MVIENLLYCSAGYNRIIVSSDGKIYKCFSRMKDEISNIYNFDFNKNHKLSKCNQLNCMNCDRSFTIRENNEKEIIKKTNYINVQISITDYCKNFCPYCFHSDNTFKYNIPISKIPIIDFISFINKINNDKIKTDFFIIGGEPLYRDDICKLSLLNKNIYIFTSLICDSNNLDNLLLDIKNCNIKIFFIITIHFFSKLFNWDLFWGNFDKVYKNNNCRIIRCSIINYNLTNNLINEIGKKLFNYNVKLEIKPLDKTMIPRRSTKKFKIL